MSEQFENIDSIFREKMFNYSTTPPESVWSDIEHDLYQSEKNNIFARIVKIAAAVLITAGISSLIWQLSKPADNILTYNNQSPEKSIIQVSDRTSDKSISIADAITTTDNKSVIRNEILSEASFLSSNFNYNESVSNNLEVSSPEDGTFNTNLPEFPSEFNTSEIIPTTDSGIKNGLNNLTKESFISGYTSRDNPDDVIFENKVKASNPVKWVLGGQIGPQYSYRNIQGNSDTVAILNKFEAPIIAYAGGVNIQMEASKRFSVQTGIFYSKIGKESYSYEIPSKEITNDNNFLSNSPADPGWSVPNEGESPDEPGEIINSIGDITFERNEYTTLYGTANTIYDKQNSQLDVTEEKITADDLELGSLVSKQFIEFIEIPFILRYKVIDRKLGINISGGFVSNFLVGNSFEVTGDNNSKANPVVSNLNRVNYSGSVGMGFQYPILKDVLFTLEPIFKYYLTPLSKSQDFETHPYTFGVMTGFSYSF